MRISDWSSDVCSSDLRASEIYDGVLQRIAIVYLACAVIVSVGRGAIVPLGLGLAIIATHTFVLLNIGAENTVASLAPGAGISGWLDRQLLPGLLLRVSWDPEGLLRSDERRVGNESVRTFSS